MVLEVDKQRVFLDGKQTLSLKILLFYNIWLSIIWFYILLHKCYIIILREYLNVDVAYNHLEKWVGAYVI
jgi:hypothetical protein